MSIPLFVDGETELDAATLNRLVNAANGSASYPIALAGIAGALVERNTQMGVVNVQDYPGVDPTGTTDSSAGFALAAQAVAALARTDESATTDGRSLGSAVLQIPPGSYLITDEDCLLAMAAGAARGYVIQGAGREVTQILFAPTTDKYLIRNDAPGWQHLTIRDITFCGENSHASFMYTDSANAQRDYTFERVNWHDFAYGFRNTGADSYDTLSFWHCAAYGTWDTFFWVEGSDQNVVHGFYDFSFEVQAGDFIKLTKGGSVNVFGGSLVLVGAGTLFSCLGASHDLGAQRLVAVGTRVELRDSTSQFLYSSWSYGSLHFESVDTSIQSYAVDDDNINVIVTTDSTYGKYPTIRWTSCGLMGRHEYRYDANQHIYGNPITYESCEFFDHADADGFLLLTDNTGDGSIGCNPVIRVRDCRGAERAILHDTDQGWHRRKQGLTTRKVVSLRTSHGTNPFSPSATYLEFKLPLNAIVTGWRVYAPTSGWAGGTPAATTWTLTLKTTEVSPTTIATAAPGTAMNAGFNVSDFDLWHPCNADDTRTLRLECNSAMDSYNTGFYGIVEYLG